MGGEIEVHVAVEAPERTWASSQGYLLLGVLPADDFRDPVLVKFCGFWVEIGVERAVKVERVVDLNDGEGSNTVTLLEEVEDLCS